MLNLVISKLHKKRELIHKHAKLIHCCTLYENQNSQKNKVICSVQFVLKKRPQLERHKMQKLFLLLSFFFLIANCGSGDSQNETVVYELTERVEFSLTNDGEEEENIQKFSHDSEGRLLGFISGENDDSLGEWLNKNEYNGPNGSVTVDDFGMIVRAQEAGTEDSEALIFETTYVGSLPVALRLPDTGYIAVFEYDEQSRVIGQIEGFEASGNSEITRIIYEENGRISLLQFFREDNNGQLVNFANRTFTYDSNALTITVENIINAEGAFVFDRAIYKYKKSSKCQSFLFFYLDDFVNNCETLF